MLSDYLADLCAVEITICLLKERINSLINKREYAVQAKQPTIAENPGPFLGFLWLIPMALLAVLTLCVVGFILWFFFQNWFFGILVGICCGFVALLMFGGVAWFWCQYDDSRERHRSDVSVYQASIRDYEREMQRWQSAKDGIPKIDQEIELIYKDLDEVERKSRYLMSFNYIPNGYRYLHALLYLYDWFSSCQSEDMDYAISRYDNNQYSPKVTHLYNDRYEILDRLLWRNSETIRFLQGLKSLQ